MAQITYTNKETLNSQPSIADKNKVKAEDMNEIKSVVNTNYGEVGDITNLNTTTKSSIVDAVNELVDTQAYSTTEVKTNKIWIDNKPIYRKVFQFTTVNNTSWTLIENNDYDYIIDVNGEVYANEHYIGIIKYINLYRLNGNLYYQNQSSFSQGKQITFWIEYTKTTD